MASPALLALPYGLCMTHVTTLPVFRNPQDSVYRLNQGLSHVGFALGRTVSRRTDVYVLVRLGRERETVY